jgi:uncharacterized protein (TIGR03435 family)
MRLRITGMLMLLVATVSAQTQRPAFDAASVKVNRSGFPGGTTSIQPGQFTATNETLKELIQAAYATERFRIIGGEPWVALERFDILARAAGNVPREQMQLMLQTLLADRFGLSVSRQLRESAIYELVQGGRPGAPGLRPAAGGCVDRGNPPTSPKPGEPPTCGALRSGPSAMNGSSVTINVLAARLAPQVGRAVIDKTNLSGAFDLDLQWTPTEAQRAAVEALRPGSGPTPVDADIPDLFTALSEQLGLRLRPERGMVDVLVIEAAKRPAED